MGDYTCPYCGSTETKQISVASEPQWVESPVVDLTYEYQCLACDKFSKVTRGIWRGTTSAESEAPE